MVLYSIYSEVVVVMVMDQQNYC